MDRVSGPRRSCAMSALVLEGATRLLIDPHICNACETSGSDAASSGIICLINHTVPTWLRAFGQPRGPLQLTVGSPSGRPPGPLSAQYPLAMFQESPPGRCSRAYLSVVNGRLAAEPRPRARRSPPPPHARDASRPFYPQPDPQQFVTYTQLEEPY